MPDLIKSIAEKEAAIENGEGLIISKDAFAPWSFSKLKIIQQCPLKFYLQYVLKVKVPGAPPSLVTNVGKAVHRVIEFLILGKTIGDSYRLAKKEFVDSITHDEWEANVATTEMNIVEFRKRLDAFEQRNPVKRYIQELRVGIKSDYTPTAFFDKEVYYRGVIDLGMQLESNDIILLDHKTGAPAAMGIKNFQDQLDTYKILFHHGVESVEGAQAGIHFVKDGKIVLDHYADKKEIEGRLVQSLEFYMIGAVDRLKEIAFFKHIRGGHCRWCDYNEQCKKGELEDVERKTKRFFPLKEVK
jgi:hypothetical protein